MSFQFYPLMIDQSYSEEFEKQFGDILGKKLRK